MGTPPSQCPIRQTPNFLYFNYALSYIISAHNLPYISYVNHMSHFNYNIHKKKVPPVNLSKWKIHNQLKEPLSSSITMHFLTCYLIHDILLSYITVDVDNKLMLNILYYTYRRVMTT